LNPQLLFLLETATRERLFALDAQTLIQIGIQLINVLLLFFVLSKVLYKPVREMLLKRTVRIRDQIQFAESEMAKATELKNEYQKKMKEIESEKIEILEAARKSASDKSKQQLAEARTEAETVKNRALHEIELEQERVKDELKKTVIEISSALAAKLLNRTIDDNLHDQLFNETMRELEEVAWHN
jgi:F-type H+-transporting ATPase subunit b